VNFVWVCDLRGIQITSFKDALNEADMNVYTSKQVNKDEFQR